MLDGLDEIVSLVWALAVICGVLALSYWFTRYVAGRASAGRPRGRQIQLLEEIPVGKDQKLLLVLSLIHISARSAGGSRRTPGRGIRRRWRPGNGDARGLSTSPGT